MEGFVRLNVVARSSSEAITRDEILGPGELPILLEMFVELRGQL